MVCDKCEAKLSKVIVPDRWKDGARNTAGGKDGGRKISGNALLGKKHRFTPMSRSCRICKTKVAQEAHYCQNCSYTKATCIAFVALLGMSSPRRTSVAKAGQSAAPVAEVVKPKPERFVLSSGHDAHDLLEAAETELKGCSGTLFDHLEQKNLEPTPLDSLSDDGDDADKDNDADDHLRQQVVYTTNLHLKALPRHGNRTRRMIMSTPTKRVSKAKPKGPRTYDELEALMKSLVLCFHHHPSRLSTPTTAYALLRTTRSRRRTNYCTSSTPSTKLRSTT
ncbi:hypothetical protein, variant [Aphanomyces astaci]|uniref:Cysteine-rich PDZ-binding protein n=1 Tax=Aphanomyces astaci TaxID=112090 RepID=W4FH00_APHAT|nr:hypothetical protein, variant [Aphanomyces astaci]ETV66033.1 hypothetical protein, variant [Aphanomyces astaci]|eukprot:XP_009844461.1 hypothetical protein, variant [Aphanomyces astaci]